MICEKCGKKYNRSDSERAYYDYFDGEGDFDWDFQDESLCPEHTIEACQEMGSNSISTSDAEDILMSQGDY